MLEKKVLDVIKNFKKEKSNLEILSNIPNSDLNRIKLPGLSGNLWKPDIVIVKLTKIKSEEIEDLTKLMKDGYWEKILVIIECKDIGREGVKPSIQTYRNHMQRAYAELGDLRNYECKKFVIVPYIPVQSRGFDYNAYFKSIGVKMIGWNNPSEHSEFKQIIMNL